MNIKEIEKIVGSIQSHLFKNSNSFSVGMLKSHFRGAGIQFKEHQVYNPGDDVRFIDWKLSAKANTTFVKTFEEERNIEIHVVLDIFSTMFMGYKKVSKLQAAIEIVCLLYLLADKTKDKVSVSILFNEVKILPPTTGQKGIIAFINELEKLGIINDKGQVDILFEAKNKLLDKKRMALLKSLVAKNKEVVYLTDFSEVENIETINKLIYRRNMHCFRLTSPLDEVTKIPFSIFGKSNIKTRDRLEGNTSSKHELEGRYKKINVEDRYLEKFVREML